MIGGDPSGKTPWWAVSLFMTTMLVAFFDRHLLVLFITPIKQSLALSDTQVGLLIGIVFTTFHLVAGVPMARLIDRGGRGGRKRLLAGGILLCGLATAALGLARGFGAVAAARMMQGAASSANAPAIFSMIGDMFRRDQLARPIAVVSIGGAAGSALALILGGVLLGWAERMPARMLPLIGWLEPWQLALLMAAVPAPMLALLILTTVREPPRRPEPEDAARHDVRDVLRHLGRHGAAYATIILGIAVNSALVLGLLVWTPSLLEREFGWPVGSPGPYLGGIVLLAAPLGLLWGGWLADRRAARGDALANVRIVLWACGGLAPAAIAYPLMPDARLALGMVAFGLFFAMMGLGPANAAIQRITPDRMRGTVTALQVASVNILGFGLGPVFVAMLTDNMFQADARLASAMTVFASLFAPLGLVVNLCAVRPYRRSTGMERLRREVTGAN